MVEMKAAMQAAICIAAAVSLIHGATAADYIVGYPAGGWGGGTVDYKAWASTQTFAPGDTLTFKYNSYHSVVEVTEDAYEACSATNPVSSDSSPSTTIVLMAPGKRYFICGAPGHCQSGMKLEVDVADRPAPTTPSPPPTLPPPRHAKRRRPAAAPAPMPLPPSPMPWSPAPAPAAAQRRRSAHKKHKRRPLPPNPASARAPTVQSVEAYFPVAAFAPMSSSPPPPPSSSDAAAVMRVKWSEAVVGLVGLGLVVLAL
ncbi:hypothetical protein ABZP36_017041 [Zizania latifolia]